MMGPMRIPNVPGAWLEPNLLEALVNFKREDQCSLLRLSLSVSVLSSICPSVSVPLLYCVCSNRLCVVTW